MIANNLYAVVPPDAGLLWAGQITAGETGFDLLTLAERAWLAEHPIAIRVCM